MAISATHYYLLRELKRSGELPQGGSILEIGKANFYGDLSPEEITSDIRKLPDDKQRSVMGRYGYLDPKAAPDLFEMARLVYDVLFDPVEVTAIDLDPAAEGSLRLDLNDSQCPIGDFDTVINHGTAEHVFNVANVFRFMHDACKVGGLLIHEAPTTGWLNHGLYNIQPTLFWSLARANGYRMVGYWLEHLRSKSFMAIESQEQIDRMALQETLPNNALSFVALRKESGGVFVEPMQDIYSGHASAESVDSWRKLR